MDRLRFCKNNKIGAALVSATSQRGAFPISNIKSNSLTMFKSIIPTCTVTILLDEDTDIDFLSLHRCLFDDIKVIGLLDAAEVFNTGLIEAPELSGIDDKSYTVNIGVGGIIDQITLEFTGDIVPEVGFICVGEAVDFGISAMQPFDISTDAPTVTNGNAVATNAGFSYRRYQITLGYDTFKTLREKIRSLIQDGSYAEPRGIEIFGDFIPTDSLLGVFDSGEFGYSINFNQDETGQFKAQLTIGLTEVFGGNE